MLHTSIKPAAPRARAPRKAARPTVTAIIPTYNRRDYIVRAIDSVLAQDPAPDEIIVVDDGSTDGTCEFVQERFGARVKVLRKPNSGVSGARRLGVLEAQGDWIAFLDSDDEWPLDRMRALLEGVRRAPRDVPWVFGNTALVADGDLSTDVFSVQGFSVRSDLDVYEDSLETQFPFQFSLLSSSLIRRDVLVATDAFAEGLRSSEDFLASFRVAIGSRFAAIPEIVSVVYRTSDLNGSSLDQQGRQGVDYFIARILAFDEAAAARGGAWIERFENAVRGCCVARARKGWAAREIALGQFRHRVTPKSLAFVAAAMLGASAVLAWEALSRGVQRPRPRIKTVLEYQPQPVVQSVPTSPRWWRWPLRLGGAFRGLGLDHGGKLAGEAAGSHVVGETMETLV